MSVARMTIPTVSSTIVTPDIDRREPLVVELRRQLGRCFSSILISNDLPPMASPGGRMPIGPSRSYRRIAGIGWMEISGFSDGLCQPGPAATIHPMEIQQEIALDGTRSEPSQSALDVPVCSLQGFTKQ